jgi:uncharacterized protein Yka (UPF0111/DUF47 family)
MNSGNPTMDKFSEETRFALMEQSINHMNQNFDSSINHINQTLERFERRFDNIDNEIKETKKELKGEIRSNFFWTLGVIASILAVVARGFHWF